MTTGETILARRLLFLGDFASPSWCPYDPKDLQDLWPDTVVVLNMEGPILRNKSAIPVSDTKHNLSNEAESLKLFGAANILVSLANNHYCDFSKSQTVPPEALGIRAFGTLDAPTQSVALGDRHVIITGFSFPAPDPRRWRRAAKDLSVMKPSRAMHRLKRLRAANPDAFLVAFVHWGYELSDLPYPADRAWARQAAEVGVDLIVGHHPHVVQPVEQFGVTQVAYSLGNFFLPAGVWHGKRLDYPGRANTGLALCLDAQGVRLFDVRHGRFDLAQPLVGDVIAPVFAGMSDSEFHRFFLANKGKSSGAVVPKGIPVLSRYIPILELFLFAWQDLRQWLRDALVSTRLHRPGGNQRKDR